MTQQSRRSHIVPQFYLRRFAEAERLTAIEIATGRILEQQHVRNVAVETDAYRSDGLVVEPGIDVEQEIAALENRFATALRDFIGQFPPSRELRNAVSDFVLFQLTRDPAKRMQYGDDRQGDWLLALGVLMNDPDDPARRGVLEENGLLEFREDARAAINERCWLLYEVPARGTAEFITSDSPVHLAGGVPDQRGLIDNADVYQLFLPLDRRHLLIMEQGSPQDDRAVKATVRDVLELNRKTVQSAIRFAYAHPGVNGRWLKSSVQPLPATT